MAGISVSVLQGQKQAWKPPHGCQGGPGTGTGLRAALRMATETPTPHLTWAAAHSSETGVTPELYETFN